MDQESGSGAKERRSQVSGQQEPSSANWTRTAETLSSQPGAYALLIQLDVDALLPPRFDHRLGPGRYLYLGSAKGPGGIRARCARHLATDKSKRWHVDWLTEHASHVSALAVIGGDECALTRKALRLTGISTPVKDLGATDCATGCRSHVLKVDNKLSRKVLIETLLGR